VKAVRRAIASGRPKNVITFTFSSLRRRKCFGSLPACFAHTRTKDRGDEHVTTRIAIVTASIVAAIGASAVAVKALHVPDPSIYVLLAAGVVALVMLRRRTS
jgi:hypothetical protein